MSRRPKPRAQPGPIAHPAAKPTRSRNVGMLIAVAVASSMLVSLAWLLLVSTAVGLVVIPDGVSYPPDWPSLNPAARNNWLHAHTVTVTGLAAVQHMFEHFGLFWQQFAAVGALTLSSALVALLAFTVLGRR